jgi:heme/copper-type cytochrome/quinol oxidase subunit 2
MVIEFLLGIKTSKLAKKPFGKIRGVLTTYFLFSLSLIFFRALGLRKVGTIFKKMFWDIDLHYVSFSKVVGFSYLVSFISIVSLILFERSNGERLFYQSYSITREALITLSMIIILILFGVFYNVSFIYFQF